MLGVRYRLLAGSSTKLMALCLAVPSTYAFAVRSVYVTIVSSDATICQPNVSL